MATTEPRPEPVAILAAGGIVPFQVATAAAAAGGEVFVVGLDGVADERLKTFPFVALKWGQLVRVPALVKERGMHRVVMVGSVTQRPDFRSLGGIDLAMLKLLPRILKGTVGGDDTVLGNLLRWFEEEGLQVVGAHEIAPNLVAEGGLVAGPRPSDAALADARVAMRVARTIGELDIGQGAVVVNGLAVAVEAAEGTDAMLERAAHLHKIGRVKWQGRAGVLVKCAKPQQDLRIDMPTIGPKTVSGAVAANLAGIVVEAGKVMIAEREATVKAAHDAGIFIFAATGDALRLEP